MQPRPEPGPGASSAGTAFKDAKILTAGVCGPSEMDGRNWLHGRGEDNWRCFSEMRDGEITSLSGYAGFYAIDALKKAGKLPS